MVKNFRQVFTGATANVDRWTVTENLGQLPSNPAAYTFLYEGGQKLTYGVHYTFNGSELVLLTGVVAWQQYELLFTTEEASLSGVLPGCYDYIVGLSETECSCVDPKPTNYNFSKSGLFLDSLQPIASMGNFENCQGGGLWTVMEKSLSEAVKQYLIDIKALVMADFELVNQPYRGTIGETSANTFLETSKQYSFLRIGCAPIRGGFLRIKNIGTMFTGTGTVTAYVFDNNNTPIATLPLLTIANQHKLNTVDLELPLLAAYSSSTEYFIVIEYDDLNRPRLNELPCGCGGKKPYFSSESPMYSEKWSGAKAWGNWLQVGSGVTNNLVFDRLNKDYETSSSHMNGLTLEVEIGCRLNDSFCLDEFNFETDPIAMSTALSIQLLAGSIIAGKMLRDTSICRANSMNRDELQKSQDDWRKEYAAIMRYNASQFSRTNTDCYQCKPDSWVSPIYS